MKSTTPELSNKLGKTMFGVVIALVTSIVTVPATYLVNSYLDRDRISIEAIEFFPLVSLCVLSNENIADLTKNEGHYRSEFNIWLDDQPDSIKKLFQERDSFSYDESERGEFCKALDRFHQLIEQRLTDIRGLKVKWERVRTAGDLQRKVGVFVEAVNSRVAIEGPVPPDDEVEELFKAKITNLKKTNEQVIEILKTVKGFKSSRTGDIEILVTLMNVGNTDGLIKSSGHYLEVLESGKSVKLPILESEGKKKIEKRSISELLFKLDYNNIKNEEKEYLTTLMRTKNKIKGVIRIKDFRNSDVTSKMFDLPGKDS